MSYSASAFAFAFACDGTFTFALPAAVVLLLFHLLLHLGFLLGAPCQFQSHLRRCLCSVLLLLFLIMPLFWLLCLHVLVMPWHLRLLLLLPDVLLVFSLCCSFPMF